MLHGDDGGSPSPKRSRLVLLRDDDDGGGIDRMSNLPDDVLGDIISLLPSKACDHTNWRPDAPPLTFRPS
jgi:hypothetical protein